MATTILNSSKDGKVVLEMDTQFIVRAPGCITRTYSDLSQVVFDFGIKVIDHEAGIKRTSPTEDAPKPSPITTPDTRPYILDEELVEDAIFRNIKTKASYQIVGIVKNTTNDHDGQTMVAYRQLGVLARKEFFVREKEEFKCKFIKVPGL